MKVPVKPIEVEESKKSMTRKSIIPFAFPD